MKEKERKSKKFEIIALIIAILVLLFCIWAFSKSREANIKDKPIVKPNDSDVNIVFSPIKDIDKIDDDKDVTEETSKTEVTGVSNSGESTGTAEVVKNEKNTIANIQVRFTKPGQEVTYTFYSHNTSKYDAYLDTITYANVNGGNFFKQCRAVDPRNTNRYLVSSACESISMVVKAGSNVITDGSITGIKDHILSSGSSEKVVVTIKYDKNGTLVDGDFVVEFGSLTLTYLSKTEMEGKNGLTNKVGSKKNKK
ncbi:MAG: hypothetical protein J6C28_00735 [Bacilli bacterium]|nr:hypothetical protein [Bacilli bacterium]